MRKAVCVLAMALIASAAFAQVKAPAASEPGAPEVVAAKKAIESANAAFMGAMKKGDATLATANYADDAIVMMPNEPAWRGRAAILKGMQGFLSAMTMQQAATHTQDVIVRGDVAIETGTFEWTLQPKGGAAVKDKGKYLTVWKRQADGSWKILRDINNTDLPAK